jgi:WD40 repeat protein
MSLAAPPSLLSARGTTRELGACVVGASFNYAGTACAFGLGDGTVHIAGANTDWARLQAHDGAVLALAPDALPNGFLSAGDDGVLQRIGVNGVLTPLFSSGGKWIEQLCSFADPRNGMIACAAGKQAHLFSAAGTKIKSLVHPSTVTGLAFDAKGKRLAASHYNGASLWYTASKTDNPRVLEWKGSHTGVAIHPAGEAVVTSMQENSLHGWRLSDGQHMRMSGYPAKTETLGFTRNGKYLASSGAGAIVLWPFFGGGPMGKPPLELAQIEGVLCTRIACHPKDELVAAGYADGSVVLAQISTQRIVIIADRGGSPVSALAWSPGGAKLALGTEGGMASVVDLSAT